VNTEAAIRADDFGADLRQALSVWSRQPLLPLISVVFWTVPSAVSGSDAADAIAAILLILFLGWPGTEREWYRRAFAGEVFPASEIWPTSRRFFGRYLGLGLLVSPVLIPLVVASVWFGSGTVVHIGVALALFFMLDVALTFVTPALTFTTSSVTHAVSLGIAMLRTHWPAAAPYALTPALGVILGAQILLEPVIGTGGTFAATALAGLLALALKGATVGFYLRHRPDLALADRGASEGPRRREAGSRRRRRR
jgi:hypothetical protein